MIAEVIVDIKSRQVNKAFDYHIPAFLENILEPGFRVSVPFGNTKRMGYVINIKNDTSYNKKIKDIIELIDVNRIFNDEFLQMGKYISDNYFSYYAKAFDAMIPSSLKVKYQKIAKLNNKDNIPSELKDIFKRKEIIVDNLSIDKQKIIYQYYKNGIVSLDTKLRVKNDNNKIKMVHLIKNDLSSKYKKCLSILNYLEEIGDDIDLDTLVNNENVTKANLDFLINNKNIFIYEIEEKKDNNIIINPTNVILSDEQRGVYESIDYNKNDTYLLHGVTSSGKTEIFIRWISDILVLNKSAILLIPEISLTPQITGILKSRFNDNIAILHSRLTPKEKFNEWKRIINKEVKIVVGARSAIFAPLENLGIIIIDEAHDDAYIQESNPKYNVIDLAKIRAKNNNIPLILATATPKICDYYYATNGEYKLLELKNRINNMKLPSVKIVDLREELKHGNTSPISKELLKELKINYENHEQSILFLNRRGHNSFVMCRSCGEVIKCPHCDMAYTYHKNSNILSCHHCGNSIINVTTCPKCGSDKIRYVGTGTERIEEELKKLMPSANIIRVDRDTVVKLEDYEIKFNEFKEHKADILIGTQMITKGLDFGNVTLVGCLNADIALYYQSYNANEEAFNILEQSSGRAGRGKFEGRVIIQTYNPNHFVIDCVKNHNYDKYYNIEITNRKIAALPPFSTLIEITIKSLDERLCYNEAIKIKDILKKYCDKSIILGPAKSPIFKKNDIYNYVITIQVLEDKVIDEIKNIYPLYQNNEDVWIEIDRG